MLRAGFLDGIYGFLIAIQSAHYTFLKYNKLRQLHRQKPWVQNQAAIQINNVQGKPLKRTSPA
jgi:hypothetical protein